MAVRSFSPSARNSRPVRELQGQRRAGRTWQGRAHEFNNAGGQGAGRTPSAAAPPRRAMQRGAAPARSPPPAPAPEALQPVAPGGGSPVGVGKGFVQRQSGQAGERRQRGHLCARTVGGRAAAAAGAAAAGERWQQAGGSQAGHAGDARPCCWQATHTCRQGSWMPPWAARQPRQAAMPGRPGRQVGHPPARLQDDRSSSSRLTSRMSTSLQAAGRVRG